MTLRRRPDSSPRSRVLRTNEAAGMRGTRLAGRLVRVRSPRCAMYASGILRQKLGCSYKSPVLRTYKAAGPERVSMGLVGRRHRIRWNAGALTHERLLINLRRPRWVIPPWNPLLRSRRRRSSGPIRRWVGGSSGTLGRIIIVWSGISAGSKHVPRQ